MLRGRVLDLGLRIWDIGLRARVPGFAENSANNFGMEAATTRFKANTIANTIAAVTSSLEEMFKKLGGITVYNLQSCRKFGVRGKILLLA